jgi:hypothetical protein
VAALDTLHDVFPPRATKRPHEPLSPIEIEEPIAKLSPAHRGWREENRCADQDAHQYDVVFVYPALYHVLRRYGRTFSFNETVRRPEWRERIDKLFVGERAAREEARNVLVADRTVDDAARAFIAAFFPEDRDSVR